ncbi:hypothetical protein DVA86_00350 [Streptomyces armeniacus]|uniref:Sugar kinase n=1 Tax=Streptomyces armeniacus TaxID=83291 RepID=A0A345XI58_9ACTN|nr:hypothetical protein [Streptomyces armeniacus]AXK31324.1 hypothetical protein DVA86_00350 [Streptomyces armeniacus]
MSTSSSTHTGPGGRRYDRESADEQLADRERADHERADHEHEEHERADQDATGDRAPGAAEEPMDPPTPDETPDETPGETPDQTPDPAADGTPGRDSPQWLRRRLITLLVVVLLIAIPAGYLVMSAFVSRDSGRVKAREATLTGLDWHWPSRVQQRIYDVDIPNGASHVAFYEQNSWKVSSLHAQFHIGNQGLESFLKSVGTSRSELKRGWTHGVAKEQADKVGWNFQTPGHRYWSLVHQRSKGTPELEITVDTASPKWPRVYVVSTVKFRGP